MKSIKAAVIGATGYAGEELVRLLYNHSEVDVKVITSKSYTGENYTDIYSNFNHITEEILQDDDLEKISKEIDIIFVALPHGILSKKITKEILENCTVCVASRNTDENIQSLRAYAFEKLGVYMPKLDGKNIHISLLDAYEVSSSEIRDRITNGKSIYGIVDPEIIEYMESHKLYGYRKK